ncbi:MAG: NAD(P)-dependent oxidoreductase [Paludibacter sp.]
MNFKKNVLLTGASGTIGTEIMKQLAQSDNVRLTVFDIKNARTKKLFAPYERAVDIIWGNISNAEDLKNIPQNLDVVIHLAAIIPPLSDEKPELSRKVNITGTQNLIQQLEKTSPNAFLLYSSSIAVYGDHVQNPFISVHEPLNAGKDDIYAQSKIECEKLIQRCGLDWSVFRLTAIMKNHKISKLMFHMPLSTIMEICTPPDTARAFVQAIGHRNELTGKIFNLGGGKSCYITYLEFLNRSFQIYGLGKADFPEHAFAERNFHCGMYVDGDELENILHFRNDTIDTYFEDQKRGVNQAVRFLSTMLRVFIKQGLLLQSEPLKAFKSKNESQMSRFFFPLKSPVTVVTS